MVPVPFEAPAALALSLVTRGLPVSAAEFRADTVFLDLRSEHAAGSLGQPCRSYQPVFRTQLAQRVASQPGHRIAQGTVGEAVNVTVCDGSIVITSTKRKRGKQNLRELVSAIPANYEKLAVDWGKPAGKEVW